MMDDATLERLLRSTIDRVDEIQTRTAQSDALAPVTATPDVRLRKVLALSTASLIELMQLADGQLTEGSVRVSELVLERVGQILANFCDIMLASMHLFDENPEVVTRVIDEYNAKLEGQQGG